VKLDWLLTNDYGTNRKSPVFTVKIVKNGKRVKNCNSFFFSLAQKDLESTEISAARYVLPNLP